MCFTKCKDLAYPSVLVLSNMVSALMLVLTDAGVNSNIFNVLSYGVVGNIITYDVGNIITYDYNSREHTRHLNHLSNEND